MIPQAYTARDIGEAYKWMLTLPDHVRAEMKTAEQMVLHYLKAKAMGQLNNYQTKTQEFQKTLQNLKTEMDQFEFNENTQPATPANPAAPTTQVQVTASLTTPPAAQPPAPQNLSQVKMDPKSRSILNEIKEAFNLSSDLEVIRMSLVLARKALKQFLDQGP